MSKGFEHLVPEDGASAALDVLIRNVLPGVALSSYRTPKCAEKLVSIKARVGYHFLNGRFQSAAHLGTEMIDNFFRLYACHRIDVETCSVITFNENWAKVRTERQTLME